MPSKISSARGRVEVNSPSMSPGDKRRQEEKELLSKRTSTSSSSSSNGDGQSLSCSSGRLLAVSHSPRSLASGASYTMSPGFYAQLQLPPNPHAPPVEQTDPTSGDHHHQPTGQQYPPPHPQPSTGTALPTPVSVAPPPAVVQNFSFHTTPNGSFSFAEHQHHQQSPPQRTRGGTEAGAGGEGGHDTSLWSAVDDAVPNVIVRRGGSRNNSLRLTSAPCSPVDLSNASIGSPIASSGRCSPAFVHHAGPAGNPGRPQQQQQPTEPVARNRDEMLPFPSLLESPTNSGAPSCCFCATCLRGARSFQQSPSATSSHHTDPLLSWIQSTSTEPQFVPPATASTTATSSRRHRQRTGSTHSGCISADEHSDVRSMSTQSGILPPYNGLLSATTPKSVTSGNSSSIRIHQPYPLLPQSNAPKDEGEAQQQQEALRQHLREKYLAQQRRMQQVQHQQRRMLNRDGAGAPKSGTSSAEPEALFELGYPDSSEPISPSDATGRCAFTHDSFIGGAENKTCRQQQRQNTAATLEKGPPTCVACGTSISSSLMNHEHESLMKKKKRSRKKKQKAPAGAAEAPQQPPNHAQQHQLQLPTQQSVMYLPTPMVVALSVPYVANPAVVASYGPSCAGGVANSGTAPSVAVQPQKQQPLPTHSAPASVAHPAAVVPTVRVGLPRVRVGGTSHTGSAPRPEPKNSLQPNFQKKDTVSVGGGGNMNPISKLEK